MILILKILGIVFLILICLAAIVIGYFVFKWKSIKALCEPSPPNPHKIQLNETDSLDWILSEEVSSPLQQLESMGFSGGKMYTVEEIPGISLVTLFKPDENVCGVVYHHDTAGIWSDFMVKFDDDTAFEVTNAPDAGNLDAHPGVKKIFVDFSESIVSVYRRFNQVKQEEYPEKGTVKIDDTNFKPLFEDEYRKEYEWRAQKGGITRAEFERVAVNSEVTVSDEQLDAAFHMAKVQELYRWHEQCIEEFIDNTTMPVSEWVEYADHLVIVSNIVHIDYYIEYLQDFIDYDAEVVKEEGWFNDTMPSAFFFEKINDTLPERQKAKKIGSVAAPIEADIYHLPPSDENHSEKESVPASDE